jgi:large subunit ribosomal protein L34
MHIRTRRSALKHRKRTGFRRRMRTRGGRAIINRQRALAAGKPKRPQGKGGLGKKLNKKTGKKR